MLLKSPGLRPSAGNDATDRDSAPRSETLDHHAAAVDVGDLEARCFGSAQSSRVGRGQCSTRLQARHCFRKRTTSPTQVTGDEGGPVTYAIIPGVRRAAVEDEGKRWRATIRLRDGAGEHGNTIPLARSANRSSLITRMPVECRQPRPSVAPSNAGSAKAMGHGTTAICRASRTSSACCVLGSGAAAAVLRTAPGAPPACEPRTSRQPPLSSQYQTHAPDEAARTNPLWLSSPRQAPPICSGDRRLRDRGWAKIHQHYWAKVR